MLQRGLLLGKAPSWRIDCVTRLLANNSLSYSTHATLTENSIEVRTENSIEARPKLIKKNISRKKLRFVGSHGKSDDSTGERCIKNSCAERLLTIRLADLEAKGVQEEAKLLNTRPICSYSWDSKNKKLYVPGTPPRFSPNLPIEISDSLRKPKSAAPPNLALRPHLWRAFEAIRTVNSPIDFASIDIVCSRKVLETLLQFCDRGLKFPGVTMHLVHQTLLLDLPLFQHKVGYGYSTYLTAPEHEALRDAHHYRWNSYSLQRPGQRLRLAVYTDVDAHMNESQDITITEETSTAYVRDTSLVRLGTELSNHTLVSFHSAKLIPDHAKPIFSRISRIMKVYFVAIGRFGWRERIRKCKEAQPSAMTRRQWIESGYKLMELLDHLKEVAQTSRHGACIAIGSGVSGMLQPKGSPPQPTESIENVKIDVFEPEFDPIVLDERDVHTQYRVTPELIPDFLVHDFWIR